MGPAGDRRQFLRQSAQAALAVSAAWAVPTRLAALGSAADRPSVAGIPVPNTILVRQAMAVVRPAIPPILFNHSMRVFVFGSIVGRHEKISYDDELLMIAALFHDVGLGERFSTADAPFELDGADAAKAFLVERNAGAEAIQFVWDAIAYHTSDLVGRLPPAVGLISEGAAIDFVGARPEVVTAAHRAAAVAAFPRLQFKKRIQEILTAFCQRKPYAQAGGWGDVYCQSHTVGIEYPKLADLIERSPFEE